MVALFCRLQPKEASYKCGGWIPQCEARRVWKLELLFIFFTAWRQITQFITDVESCWSFWLIWSGSGATRDQWGVLFVPICALITVCLTLQEVHVIFLLLGAPCERVTQSAVFSPASRPQTLIWVSLRQINCNLWENLSGICSVQWPCATTRCLSGLISIVNCNVTWNTHAWNLFIVNSGK